MILTVGSTSKVPDLPGLADVPFWTNRDATGGAGAAGEPPGPGRGADRRRAVAGVRPLRRAGDAGRAEPADPAARPRAQLGGGRERARARWRDDPHRCPCRRGARGRRREPGGIGSTSTTAQASRAPRSCWRSAATCRSTTSASTPSASMSLRASCSRISSCASHPAVFVAGDPAGPEMHTHVSHYEGEMTARIALGEDVTPDFRAIPRAVYTDPGERLSRAAAGAGAEARASTPRSSPATWQPRAKG